MQAHRQVSTKIKANMPNNSETGTLAESQCPMKGCDGTGHVLGNFSTHRSLSGCPLSVRIAELQQQQNDPKTCPMPGCDGSGNTKSMYTFHRSVQRCPLMREKLEEYKGAFSVKEVEEILTGKLSFPFSPKRVRPPTDDDDEDEETANVAAAAADEQHKKKSSETRADDEKSPSSRSNSNNKHNNNNNIHQDNNSTKPVKPKRVRSKSNKVTSKQNAKSIKNKANLLSNEQTETGIDSTTSGKNSRSYEIKPRFIPNPPNNSNKSNATNSKLFGVKKSATSVAVNGAHDSKHITFLPTHSLTVQSPPTGDENCDNNNEDKTKIFTKEKSKNGKKISNKQVMRQQQQQQQLVMIKEEPKEEKAKGGELISRFTLSKNPASGKSGSSKKSSKVWKVDSIVESPNASIIASNLDSIIAAVSSCSNNNNDKKISSTARKRKFVAKDGDEKKLGKLKLKKRIRKRTKKTATDLKIPNVLQPIPESPLLSPAAPVVTAASLESPPQSPPPPPQHLSLLNCDLKEFDLRAEQMQHLQFAIVQCESQLKTLQDEECQLHKHVSNLQNDVLRARADICEIETKTKQANNEFVRICAKSSVLNQPPPSPDATDLFNEYLVRLEHIVQQRDKSDDNRAMFEQLKESFKGLWLQL